MQYSLLTEVWGNNYTTQNNNNSPCKKNINAGDVDNLAAEIKDEVGNGNQELENSQTDQMNTINSDNPIEPNTVKLINPEDISYTGGGIIKNDNYILLGLLLLFIVDTFYNL